MKQSLALTGTNSVDVGAVVATPRAGQLTCVRNLEIPSHTGRLAVWMGLQHPAVADPLFRGTLTAADGRMWHVSTHLGTDDSGHYREFPLSHGDTGGRSSPGTFCFRALGTDLDLGGATINGFPGFKPTTVAGAPLTTTDLSVLFLTKRHTGSRLYTRLDEAFARANLFKDYPGGAAVMWLLVVGFFLVGYFTVRTAATVEEHDVLVLARRATALAAFAGIAWALMMPVLHGADEPEHLAYVQRVAETGKRADSARGPRPAYSTDESLLMGAVRHSSTVLNHSARVPWERVAERRYDAALRGDPSRKDGGGFTESASGHSPLYYGLVAIPYKVFAGALDLAQLSIVLRIFTALLASLIAGLAVWCASLLFPRLPAAWWLAGMLVALQPVFNSISATVNNDTLVNLLAAVAITLVIHAWRHGPRTRTMIGLGTVTALLPVAKITGFELWPAVAIGLLLVIAGHHRREDLTRVAAMPAAALATAGAWVLVVAPLLGGGRGALLNAHKAGSIASASPSGVGISHSDQLNYLVQMFLPFVHLGQDVWHQQWPLYSVYVERGYGRFGWLDAHLSARWVELVGVALALGWLAAGYAAFRGRGRWRRWAPGAGILVVAIASVITFVAVAYTTKTPIDVPGEQGRYIFPALVPLGVLMAGGIAAFKSSSRAVVVGAGSTLLPAFAAFAWLAALADWYT